MKKLLAFVLFVAVVCSIMVVVPANFAATPAKALVMPNVTGNSEGEYYLPSDSGDVKVTAAWIPSSYSQRPCVTQTQKYLVIHNTGNYASTASAKSHHSWLTGTNLGSGSIQSFHYVCGSDGIYQLIPENERAYHTGTNSNSSGTYDSVALDVKNSNAIGIEICVNGFPATASFSGEQWNTDAMYSWYTDYFATRTDYAAVLAASVLVRNGFDPNTRCVQHYSVNGKNCPMQMRYVFGTAGTSGYSGGTNSGHFTKMGTYYTIFWNKMMAYYEAFKDNSTYSNAVESPVKVSASNKQAVGSAVTYAYSDTVANEFTLNGWSDHSVGISKIQYKVGANGTLYNLPTQARTDISSTAVGYNGVVSYEGWGGGTHNLFIVGTTTAGKTYNIAQIPITLTDSKAPVISDVKVTNVDATGYTVSCKVVDNSGAVASVQFPTWTTVNGQDDIVWLDGKVSGTTASVRVPVSSFNNAVGNYDTHIYATDGSGNKSDCAIAPTTAVPSFGGYPTDGTAYIPVYAVNGSTNVENSTVLTSASGAFSGVYWGAVKLTSLGDNVYEVAAIYKSGSKNVSVSGNDVILAVYEGLNFYSTLIALQVGDQLAGFGVNPESGVCLDKAYFAEAKIFRLSSDSTYSLDSENLNVDKPSQTAATVASQFMCEVSIVGADGTALESNALVGTGCKIQEKDGTGAVINEVIAVVIGDADGDGLSNTTDAATVKLHVKSLAALSKESREAVDFNGDGTICSVDYLRLKLSMK